jgi:hypothetical protein
MIGVGSSSGSNKPCKVTGCNGISSGTADTNHGINAVNNLTGSHITDPAAGTAGAKQTGRHAPILNAVIGSADLLGKILIKQINGRTAGYIITAFATFGFGHT